ncbi:MAG: hypothetical protein ACLT8D_01330 [Oscillospiraceae bacterium]
MEKFYPTKAGIEYAALTAQGKIIEFTKGKFGDGVRSTENITELTDLIHPLGELPISKKSVKNSTIITTTQFSNRVGGSILPTFYLMEIGLFAKVVNADGTDDDEHPETLIGYAFDGHGDKIIGTSLSEFIINIPLTVADVNNVTVDIDSLVYPTLKQFEDEVNTRKTEDEELQNSLNVHITDTSNPHGVTAEQIGLDKVPNVATNDQTPTYSQNSTLSNIVSGEKISVSFGKIMKAIADLISHIGSKSNPHSVTKSQVGLDNVPNVATNDQQPTFAESGTRSNIVSGETLSTLFGKIKKFFTDLKTVAFTGSYTDLSNKPTSMQNPNSLTLTMNGSATSYNGASSASKSWYAPTSGGTAGYNLISNGSGAPVWRRPLYATCTTSNASSAKTVNIVNFKLITGVRVFIKFDNANSANTPTLNISNTGAKSMVTFLPNSFYNVSSPSGTTTQKAVNTWCAGDILEFVYDGTNWVCVGTSGYPQYSHRNSSYITIGTTEMSEVAYPDDIICDFLCDGTNDTTIIQRAINLASQGASTKIRFLDGDYTINSELTLFSSIAFEGTGNVFLFVTSQGLLRYDNASPTGVSNKATFKDINISFISTNNDNEDMVGAFENFELTFENCIISKRTTYQSIWRLFFNCKVKMINTDVNITMPTSGWGATLDCFWVFGESTVELLNTHIWFTGKNPVNNGVFYDSKGTMTGGWITNTKKDTNNHGVSYILSNSPITFLGTQIRCREFAQDWNTSSSDGYRPSLDSCKIEILDGGSFSCSHAGHIDLVLSSSSKTSIIPACALISNSKLFITFDHQLVLRDYAFLEACYINRVNYKGSGSSSSAKTTDTITVTSMVKPIFIDTEGTNNE